MDFNLPIYNYSSINSKKSEDIDMKEMKKEVDKIAETSIELEKTNEAMRKYLEKMNGLEDDTIEFSKQPEKSTKSLSENERKSKINEYMSKYISSLSLDDQKEIMKESQERQQNSIPYSTSKFDSGAGFETEIIFHNNNTNNTKNKTNKGKNKMKPSPIAINKKTKVKSKTSKKSILKESTPSNENHQKLSPRTQKIHTRAAKRVAIQNFIFDKVIQLLEGSIPVEYLIHISDILSKDSYSEVIEERKASHSLCGYPACANTISDTENTSVTKAPSNSSSFQRRPNRKAPSPSKKKFQISFKLGQVFQVEQLSKFCSDTCCAASLGYLETLSEVCKPLSQEKMPSHILSLSQWQHKQKLIQQKQKQQSMAVSDSMITTATTTVNTNSTAPSGIDSTDWTMVGLDPASASIYNSGKLEIIERKGEEEAIEINNSVSSTSSKPYIPPPPPSPFDLPHTKPSTSSSSNSQHLDHGAQLDEDGYPNQDFQDMDQLVAMVEQEMNQELLQMASSSSVANSSDPNQASETTNMMMFMMSNMNDPETTAQAKEDSDSHSQKIGNLYSFFASVITPANLPDQAPSPELINIATKSSEMIKQEEQRATNQPASQGRPTLQPFVDSVNTSGVRKKALLTRVLNPSNISLISTTYSFPEVQVHSIIADWIHNLRLPESIPTLPENSWLVVSLCFFISALHHTNNSSKSTTLTPPVYLSEIRAGKLLIEKAPFVLPEYINVFVQLLLGSSASNFKLLNH